MPKIVDHAARREELAGAVWRLVGREGIEAATVRAVAAESGWSMGAVRHYFGTHSELLLFAAQVMAQRVGDRVVALYAAALQPGGNGGGNGAHVGRGDPEQRLDRACRALEQLLPMDEERTVEVLVWLAFMTRARVDRGLDELRHSGWVGERLVCRTAVADVRGAPLPTDLDARLDPALEAAVDRVHVAVDGLSLQAATYPEQWPAEALAAAVRCVLVDATAAT